MPRVKRQVSLLFLDVKGYSNLRSDHQYEIFFEAVLSGMSGKIQQYEPIYANSWGDAILAVFDGHIKAAQCALDIRDYFRHTNWEALGLGDPPLVPRIALHAGSVFFGPDPIQGRDGIAGHNVNLTSRIEPVTPPGEVWASEAFTIPLREELLAEKNQTIRVIPVGSTELAKQWGTRELFCIRRDYDTDYEQASQVSLDDIEGALLRTSQKLSATSCSVLVLDKKAENKFFFFLCAFGPNSEKLKQLRIPSDQGIAGFVASRRLSYITNDLAHDRAFAPNVAHKADIVASSMLTVPIVKEDKTLVGVAQFINKQGGKFDSEDEKTALDFASANATTIDEFVSFKLASDVPLMHYQGIRECTTIFTDLTNYNQIADRFELAIVTNLLNEYLTRVCQAALDHDCWIDKFLGDGVMIVTNTPQEKPDFCLAAVKLAVDIQNRIEDLVAEWLRYHLPVRAIKSRIGIATGKVYLGNMGHPKVNWYTAVGSSVNLAWRLLEFGDRTDHCIMMCPRSYQLVKDYVEAEAVQTPYKEVSIEPGVSYKLKKMRPTAI